MDLKRLLRFLGALVVLSLASSASAQSLKVQYRPTWIAVNDNQIALVLNVVNTGSTTVALNTVTVRYYFTKEGSASPAYYCDYTPRGCSNITGSFSAVSPAAATADTYFQVGFSSGAGSLSPGQSTGDIQIRIAKSDWSAFNEANDYSYAGNSSLTDSQNIAAFVSGTLVWGFPPGGGPTADFSLSASPASVSVIRSGVATSTISITRTSFTSAVAFSASGLPSGVTASFSPASATGASSTVTFSASSSATVGTTAVTITGTGGSPAITRTAQITLTVGDNPTQDFTLSAIPASLSLAAGTSAVSTIAITRTSFTSAVAFTVSGLPSGITASFSPTSTTGNSVTVTFSAPSVPAATTAIVTITGTGGSPTLTRTTQITLTVGTPTQDFTLSASPATVNVSTGASAVSTITITRTNFTSAVAFTASGLPTGVTATFTPASTTGNSVNVTFAASSAAAAGTTAVTITGTGGSPSITRTAQISLTVGIPQQNFSLTASPTTVSVTTGSSAGSTLTITRTNFTSAVTFTTSTLPSGVTATFSPTSATGSSATVTFAATSAAATGSTAVTITGTGGSPSITRTVQIALSVSGTCTGTACGGWRVNANGRVTHNGSLFQFHCGSWFGLQGRYEIATDSANPRGAPMEQYIGNTFWANGGQGTGRTIAGDFAEMKKAGITVIRLPVVHQTLDKTDPQGTQYLKNHSSVRIADSRTALETMLKEADKAGVFVLLDIHSCSNYVDWRKGRLDARPPWVDANRSNYDYKREDCSCASDNNPSTVKRVQAYNESLWLQDLKTLAGMNKALSINSVLGIDIYNEPWDYSWSDWKTLIEHAYQAVDSVDSNLLIFAQGISASHGNQLGVGSTPVATPHGTINPNWGENLYEAGDDPPNVPKERLVYSPHAYGPSVAVQPQFLDPSQTQCAGLQEQDAATAKCNIVINPTLLKQGWDEHFGYLKDRGYAVIVGEWGGNLLWPKGKASQRDQQLWSYLPTASPGVDEQWQNAFTDYMVSKGIESCYWSINPESGDTLGWYDTPYDPVSNTGGWGEWSSFVPARTALLNKVWNGIK